MRRACDLATPFAVVAALTLLPGRAAAQEAMTDDPRNVLARGIEGPIAPALATHVHVLAGDGERYVATTMRHRALGAELVSQEVDGGLALGRTFGPLMLATNAWIGRGLGIRPDVDVEADALASVRVTRLLRLGGAARVRGEVVDGLETVEDEGRPVDVLAGGVCGLALGDRFVQALGGWSLPRGPFRAGPAVVASAGFVF